MTGRHDVGIIDTSTFILMARIADAETLPREPVITAITLAELTLGPIVATSDEERARRQSHLQEAEASFDAVAFDDDSARAFGRVAASLRASGRKPTARSFDALIAATALAHRLPLYTCSPSDFQDIEGLEVVAVPVPGA